MIRPAVLLARSEENLVSIIAKPPPRRPFRAAIEKAPGIDQGDLANFARLDPLARFVRGGELPGLMTELQQTA